MNAGRLNLFSILIYMGSFLTKVFHRKHEVAEISDKQLDKFLNMIEPLDLIVFRGGDFVSNTILTAEKMETGCGDVSHVGVAISRKYCDIGPIKTKTSSKDNDNTLFVFESTMSGGLSIDGVYDAETNKGVFGVQLRVLRDLIPKYLEGGKSNVGVCKLLDNPIHKFSESELKEVITSTYEKYNGRTYNANIVALLGALFPALRPLRWASEEVLDEFTQANKWLFCSQFVAAFYEAIGVITDDTDGVHDGKLLDPADIVPVDFLNIGGGRDEIVKPICAAPIWIKPN